MRPNIHILGIQGSGKGTQSSLLVERYQLSYISSGSLFRERATWGDAFGDKIAALLESGTLLPTEDLIRTIRDHLQKHPITNGLLGDGVIRSLEQQVVFASLWPEYDLEEPFLIHLHLDDATAMQRIHRRRAQAKGKEQRTDETPAAITRRIRQYHEVTEPVIAYYQDRQRCLEIDASPAIDEVFATIIAGIEKHFPQLLSHESH